jgi:formate hydrogenlyase subunit 6/NADH:ubiquinone oxidoreductase subunit I
MGELAMPGFTIPDIKQDTPGSLFVDCWKVPRKVSPDDAVRVPCLGGLSAGRIADLAVSAGERSVVFLDRGWCAACRAGGGDNGHPVHSALETARLLLEKAGMAAGELPRLESLPLPVEHLPVEIPAPVTEQQLSRRAFFSALASKTVGAIEQVKPLMPQTELRRRRGFEREPVLSRERKRLLSGLQFFVQRTGQILPAELFYRLEISDACRNHLLCAKVCPTGALDIYEEEKQSGLVFDHFACIGCGHCVTVCPSDAIKLLPNGDNPVSGESVKMTCFGEKDCPECGCRYSASGDENLCPQCAKRRNLASSAFRTLFGGGA